MKSLGAVPSYEQQKQRPCRAICVVCRVPCRTSSSRITYSSLGIIIIGTHTVAFRRSLVNELRQTTPQLLPMPPSRPKPGRPAMGDWLTHLDGSNRTLVVKHPCVAPFPLGTTNVLRHDHGKRVSLVELKGQPAPPDNHQSSH